MFSRYQVQWGVILVERELYKNFALQKIVLPQQMVPFVQKIDQWAIRYSPGEYKDESSLAQPYEIAANANIEGAECHQR